MGTPFDIQGHLNAMEERLLDGMATIRQDVQQALIDQASIDQRLKGVEKKVGWVEKGAGVAILGAGGWVLTKLGAVLGLMGTPKP